MFQSINECSIGLKSLVPPTVLRRKSCCNKDFIYRRIKSQGRKALCKCSGIFGKQFGKIGILKITQPVRYTEMTKVHYGSYVKFFQFPKCHVRKFPIILTR